MENSSSFKKLGTFPLSFSKKINKFLIYFQKKKKKIPKAMRREGQLNGKASNKSKQRGKCRVKGCHMCHVGDPSCALCKNKGATKNTRIQRSTDPDFKVN